MLAARTGLADVWPIFVVPIGLFAILAVTTAAVMYGLRQTGDLVAQLLAWRVVRRRRPTRTTPLALPAPAPIPLPPAPRVFVMPPIVTVTARERQLVGASAALSSTS